MNDQDRQAIDGLFAKLGEAEGRTGPRDSEAEGYIARRVAAQPAAPYLMAQTIVMQDYALKQAQVRIEELERRVQEAAQQAAEQTRRPASGGLFGGLFGSGEPPRQGSVPSVPRAGTPFGAPAAVPADASSVWQQGGQPGGPYAPPPQGQPGYGPSGYAQPGYGQPGAVPQGFGRPGFGGGGGFLAGAAQTAVGVAGGVLLGNAISSMFGGHTAQAAPVTEIIEEQSPTADASDSSDPRADDYAANDSGSSGDDGGWFDGGGWFGGDDQV